MNDDPALRRWVHEMRNAVNTVGVSVTVARRLLAEGETVRALDYLVLAEEGCERCRALAHGPPGRVASSEESIA